MNKTFILKNVPGWFSESDIQASLSCLCFDIEVTADTTDRDAEIESLARDIWVRDSEISKDDAFGEAEEFIQFRDEWRAKRTET